MADASSLKEQLAAARADVLKLLDETNCAPILIRLAWHDSGTFDATVNAAWPLAGGANASIRFEPEILHGANAGLRGALALLEPIKAKYPLVSWADLMQLGSATAVEFTGGPRIAMRYGRVDVTGPEQCPKEGNLPAAAAPFPAGEATPAQHLRNVFHRMGFNDQEIVALSGAHTLGRAHKSRSGFGQESTKFTCPAHVARHDGKAGIGRTEGGSAWTSKWLTFDNSYFTTLKDAAADGELLRLPTDACLFEDEAFRPHAERYAADQANFFAEYAAAHLKLSELGSKFEPEGGVTLD